MEKKLEIKDSSPDIPEYRYFVGPPQRYDFIAAMVFNLLTCLGLREEHHLLDIGCCSLRIGRLLIPYLNSNNYWGTEPNGWLVEEGVKNEIGKDLVEIKKPHFVISEYYDEIPENLFFDFILAHSIFTHAPISLIKYWLDYAKSHLTEKGIMIATFFLGNNDYDGQKWVYPDGITFKFDTILRLAKSQGLFCSIVDWRFHHNQSWLLFSKYNYEIPQNLSWNNPLIKR